MRIIIAGGSGLIGRELTSSLVDRGDSVILLSRNPTKIHGLPSGVNVAQWNGKDLGEWQNEMDESDVVINLTGENLSGSGMFPSRWTSKRKVRIRSSRINSGKVLAEAVRLAKKKPTTFIQASGINYYQANVSKPLTEDAPAGNDFLANLCIAWEASSKPVETYGVRHIVVRNGIVLSNKHGALLPLILQFRLYAGGPIGSGRQMYSWIHMDDEIQAILFLIDNNQAHGVYNLTSPNPVPNRDFGKAIAKILRRPYYLPIPDFIMRLAFGEVSSLVLDGREVLPKKLIDLGYKFKFPEITEALNNLLHH